LGALLVDVVLQQQWWALVGRGKERGAVLMFAKLNKEREYKGKEAWISSLLNQYYFFLREVGTYNCSLKYGF
jgi:hypothetical protein